MLRECNSNDSFLIKRIYRKFNNFDGIDAVYFIIADGTVISVNSHIKDTPEYKSINDLSFRTLRFGGFCSKNDGGMMVGLESKSEMKWKFKCLDCGHEVIIDDKKVDEHVHNSLCLLEKDDLFR